MSDEAIIYADITETLAHPIARVWAVIGAFGGLEQWAAGVTGCTVEGQGVGAVRTVSIGERSVREQLVAIDPAKYHLRYRILLPHAMPATDVCSDIELCDTGEGATQIRWWSQAGAFTVPPEKVGAGIEAFYRKSVAGLDRLLGELIICRG